jgi:hypothetical protein
VTSSRGSSPGDGTARRAAVTAGAYVALLLLGGVQGLVGTFQYSRGPGPLAAILFAVAIGATCVLGSWGMRAAPGGAIPAVGWVIVAVALTSVSRGGSVLVANTSAGGWFLYGGAVSAAAGAVYAFARWSRPRQERR